LVAHSWTFGVKFSGGAGQAGAGGVVVDVAVLAAERRRLPTSRLLSAPDTPPIGGCTRAGDA